MRLQLGRERANLRHQVLVAHALNDAAASVVMFLPLPATALEHLQRVAELVEVPFDARGFLPPEIPAAVEFAFRHGEQFSIESAHHRGKHLPYVGWRDA